MSIKSEEMKTPESVLEKARQNEEPTFTIRAKDKHSIVAMKAYQNAIENDPDVSDEFCREIDMFVSEFQAWQETHPNEMKSPD